MYQLKTKMSRIVKRVWALVLTGTLSVSLVNSSAVQAADGTSTGAGISTGAGKILVTPFAGQSCYYGQTKTFVKDEHYSLSEDTDQTVSLGLQKDEPGMQDYVLTGGTEYFELAADSPKFEIKSFKTDARASLEREYCNDPGQAVLQAPDDFQIAVEDKKDAAWGASITPSGLVEGANEITYYLRSNANDNTRRAIDQTPKKATVYLDTVRPVLTLAAEDPVTDVTAGATITSSEIATYYYLVVSDNYFKDTEDSGDNEGEEGEETVPSPNEIRKKVESNEGIVGYGRIDKEKQIQLSIRSLKPETSYVMYALLVDKAGNESEVKTVSFTTQKTALTGTVAITGNVAVDSTLTAAPNLTTVDPGTDVSYQWYRIKLDSDTQALEQVVDETGGAEKDDLEADEDDTEDGDEDDDEDDGDNDGDEDEEDEDDEVETDSIKKLAEDREEELSIENATLIEGAVSPTYKVTRSDIGYRLLVTVRTSNSSGMISGSTATFVPKLMPVFTTPVIVGAEYSPVRTLSSIKLPGQWSWVDHTIVPVVGNSGYRARFVPADPKVYKTVIIRIKVPVTKRTLKKSMVKAPKTVSYKGKAIKDNITARDQKKKLNPKKDYKITYKNNKRPGKATVTLKGVGNYKGTVKVSYRIVKKSVKKLACQYDKTRSYTGKKRTISVSLKNDTVKLKRNTDYTVEYKNNVMIGKATVVIRGKGNYKGKRTLHFTIVPGKPKIQKITRTKNKFRLSMTPDRTVNGYYVYVSTAKSFAKAKTQQYSTTGSRFGVHRLKKGTYYVRVRSYVSRKGKLYASAYSKTKTVRIKK